MSFLLTELLSRNQSPGNLLRGTIRPDQIAAGGWSLGGYAALALAGGDDDSCDISDLPPGPLTSIKITRGDWCRPILPDPRFKAIVSHDGSSWALHFDEMKRISVPVLSMGQEWGKLLTSMGPDEASWHARQHAATSGNPSYRLDVFNANHTSFSDGCEELMVIRDLVPEFMTPELFAAQYGSKCIGVTSASVVHGLVAKYTAAFLKTYLAGESGYGQILTPEWTLTREPYVEFFTRERLSADSITTDWPDDSAYFQHQEGK